MHLSIDPQKWNTLVLHYQFRRLRYYKDETLWNMSWLHFEKSMDCFVVNKLGELLLYIFIIVFEITEKERKW